MENIWDNIFRREKTGKDEIESILYKIPLFQDLNKRELGLIKRILHKREYRSGEVVFHQGDPGLGMYIIVRGIIKIVCGPENNLITELKEGDFFGELALLDDAPRSATAIAKEPSLLLGFFKPELLDIITRNPKLGCKVLFKLAWIIGERLKKTNEQLNKLKCVSPRDEV